VIMSASPLTAQFGRILHVEGNEDGTVGGSHRGLVDLVTGLDRTRFQPIVLFYQDNEHVGALRHAGIDVSTWDTVRQHEREVRRRGGVKKYIDYLGAIRRRVALLRELRIGLVHMNNTPYSGFDDWLPAARIVGIPCITFAMGDAVVQSAALKFMARRFDHVIAISDYMYAAMRSAGISERCLTLAHLGVDGEALRAGITQSRVETRTALGILEDDVLVVMVGNIRQWKGQLVLVEAVVGLEDRLRARVQVRFVGAASTVGADATNDEEYRRVLDARIAEAGLGGCVRFLGARRDVPALFAAADIAVHASVIAEPFGLVVPEAMVHGTPVIASKFGGPGEVITSECGRVFDPSTPAELTAHLTELATDAELRRSLGAEARTRVEAFSVRSMVATVEGVYERLLPA